MSRISEIEKRIEEATKVKYRVHFIDGDGKDDWQLMRNDHYKDFDNRSEAEEFAKTKAINKARDYWQPRIDEIDNSEAISLVQVRAITDLSDLLAAYKCLDEALEKIWQVDHPSISDKTSWIVMLESVCVCAREARAKANLILEAKKGEG